MNPLKRILGLFLLWMVCCGIQTANAEGKKTKKSEGNVPGGASAVGQKGKANCDSNEVVKSEGLTETCKQLMVFCPAYTKPELEGACKKSIPQKNNGGSCAARLNQLKSQSQCSGGGGGGGK